MGNVFVICDFSSKLFITSASALKEEIIRQIALNRSTENGNKKRKSERASEQEIDDEQLINIF